MWTQHTAINILRLSRTSYSTLKSVATLKNYHIKILNLWYINGKLKVSYTDFDKDTKMTIKYVVNQYYFTF